MVYPTGYNVLMKRLLPLLLLALPLAAPAAEWHYDGEMTASTARDTAETPTGGTVTGTASLGRDVPINNMTMSGVRNNFGEPERILDAVGEPPITRWQYPGYIVYFEHDLVITTVGGHL